VLRCPACQERFTAPLPQDVATQKYDPTRDVSLALAKYGVGLRSTGWRGSKTVIQVSPIRPSALDVSVYCRLSCVLSASTFASRDSKIAGFEDAIKHLLSADLCQRLDL
jgi:hypothetical protein